MSEAARILDRMSDHDAITLAYLAGFFDGEGHISLSPKPRGVALTCAATNTVRAPLDMLQARCGGSVVGPHKSDVPNGKPFFRWQVYAGAAERFLVAVLPYLVIKRERADLALEFRSWTTGDNQLKSGWSAHSQSEIEKRRRVMTVRLDLQRRMTLLNRKGVL